MKEVSELIIQMLMAESKDDVRQIYVPPLHLMNEQRSKPDVMLRVEGILAQWIWILLD
jgi:hypothetical protein